jgi:hypothetical protein
MRLNFANPPVTRRKYYNYYNVLHFYEIVLYNGLDIFKVVLYVLLVATLHLKHLAMLTASTDQPVKSLVLA